MFLRGPLSRHQGCFTTLLLLLLIHVSRGQLHYGDWGRVWENNEDCKVPPGPSARPFETTFPSPFPTPPIA